MPKKVGTALSCPPPPARRSRNRRAGPLYCITNSRRGRFCPPRPSRAAFNRIRAVCNRRFTVPNGTSNRSAISLSDCPLR